MDERAKLATVMEELLGLMGLGRSRKMGREI